MRLRTFNVNDIDAITTIFNRQPDLGIPSIKNVADAAIIEDENGKIIAYGVVKLYAEGVLILDKDVRKRTKSEVVINMIKRAIKAARNSKLEQLFVISNDANYSHCLMKRFGFKKTSGETLFLELED